MLTLPELFHQSLEALPLILRGLGREKRLSPEDLEDIQSDIQIKLLEDDYRILQRWNRHSDFKAYLVTVVYNVWHDRVRSEKGYVRVSAMAKRLGPPAPELEMLLGRQRLTLDEAYQVIKPRFPGLSRAEVEEIAAQINLRWGRHFESADRVSERRDPRPTGDERLERWEGLAKKRNALALMHQLLWELPEEDRLLLVRAHAEGVKFSQIAKSLGGTDQRSLYRRNERLITKLRTVLEEAGIRWEDLNEVQGIDECEPLYCMEPSLTAVTPERDTIERHLPDCFERYRKRKALALVHQLLSELPEEDRLLLEGGGFFYIAMSLCIDQQVVDRRYERLRTKLRTTLEEAGIHGEDRRELLFDETLASRALPSMMPVTKPCGTTTAAFLSGSLMRDERDSIVRHLNHCPDCLQRYTGAARLLDAIEEEEVLALSAANESRTAEPSLLQGVENLKKLPKRSLRLVWLPWLSMLLLRLAVHILNFIEQARANGSARMWERPLRRTTRRPAGALRFALLARRVVELVGGSHPWRLWLRGYAAANIAYILANNDLPGAEAEFARARRFWDDGAAWDAGNLSYTIVQVVVLGLESSLRKIQGHFPEALRRIEEALAVEPGDLRGCHPLDRTQILKALGDFDASAGEPGQTELWFSGGPI